MPDNVRFVSMLRVCVCVCVRVTRSDSGISLPRVQASSHRVYTRASQAARRGGSSQSVLIFQTPHANFEKHSQPSKTILTSHHVSVSPLSPALITINLTPSSSPLGFSSPLAH
eukprot:1350067-Amorphochlora_amoeboformis.AAC.1